MYLSSIDKKESVWGGRRGDVVIVRNTLWGEGGVGKFDGKHFSGEPGVKIWVFGEGKVRRRKGVGKEGGKIRNGDDRYDEHPSPVFHTFPQSASPRRPTVQVRAQRKIHSEKRKRERNTRRGKPEINARAHVYGFFSPFQIIRPGQFPRPPFRKRDRGICDGFNREKMKELKNNKKQPPCD